MTRKRIVLTVLIALITFSGIAYDDVKRDGAVKDKNLFVFKTDKTLVGATVEVYSSNGEFIASQNLQRRKMIIDFGEVKYGTYIIRIAKGDWSQEFTYIKY